MFPTLYYLFVTMLFACVPISATPDAMQTRDESSAVLDDADIATLMAVAHICDAKQMELPPPLKHIFEALIEHRTIRAEDLVAGVKDAHGIIAPLPDSEQKSALVKSLQALSLYHVPAQQKFKYSLTVNEFVDNNNNAAFGNEYTAESFLPSAANNTFIGASTGQSTTIGKANTGLGYQALNSNTIGDENTASGVQALSSNTSGDRNSATGYQALLNNTSGNDNTAMGHSALANNAGDSNTAFGSQAMASTSTGNNNTAVGYTTMYNNNTGHENTALGYAAMYNNNSGVSNVAIGFKNLYSNSSGSNNTAIGYKSMFSNTTGINNTAIGTTALSGNTAGQQNTAIGQGSLAANLTGNNNAAVGFQALIRTTGYDNTAVGSRALQNLRTGASNIALGCQSGSSLAGSENNTIYIGNVGAHQESQTTRLGTTGTHTACYIAGNLTLPTGNLYLPVGSSDIYGNSTFRNDLTVDGTLHIANLSVPGSVNFSGVAGNMIGGFGHFLGIDFANVAITPGGELGTVSGFASSRRYKDDIKDVGSQADAFKQLRPVTFTYKQDPQKRLQFGLVAEEVADLLPHTVVFDKENRPDAIRYELFTPLLINEVLAQEKRLCMVEQQATTFDSILSRLDKIEAALGIAPEPTA